MSRLVIESVNGFAFVNFSAFLGHPKTVHVAPPEKDKLGRKSRKKSKKKTERDNERAARFQASKRQCERDAAASEASMGASPPPTTSSPSSAFIFSEPIPENVSSNSNFADLNIDGNVTISSEASRTDVRTDVRTGVGTTKSAVTCSPEKEAELILRFGEFMGNLVASTPAKIQASLSKHQEDKKQRRL